MPGPLPEPIPVPCPSPMPPVLAASSPVFSVRPCSAASRAASSRFLAATRASISSLVLTSWAGFTASGCELLGMGRLGTATAWWETASSCVCSAAVWGNLPSALSSSVPSPLPPPPPGVPSPPPPPPPPPAVSAHAMGVSTGMYSGTGAWCSHHPLTPSTTACSSKDHSQSRQAWGAEAAVAV